MTQLFKKILPALLTLLLLALVPAGAEAAGTATVTINGQTLKDGVPAECGEETATFNASANTDRGRVYGTSTCQEWDLVWQWSDDGTTCTVTFTCKNDSSKVVTKKADKVRPEIEEPTCTEKGMKACTASVFFEDAVYTNVKRIEIPASGHSFTNYEYNNDATCTQDGTETARCDRCEVTDTRTKAGTALGHKWGDPAWQWADDGKTCTVSFTCQNDSSHVEKPAVTVTATIKTPATCTDKGVTTYTASAELNGKTYTATKDVADIEASGHKTELKNAKEPTCTEKGYTGDQVCTVCGTTVEKGTDIPATGHKLEVQNAKEATCTEAGYTGDQVCTVCGTIVEKGTEIPASGHKWSDWTVTKAPTCTEEGTQERTCTICGAKETQAIKANGHQAVKTEAKAATCTEAGNIEYWYCDACGKYFSDEALTQEITKEDTIVKALGHTFKDGKCAVCGAADPNYQPPADKPGTGAGSQTDNTQPGHTNTATGIQGGSSVISIVVILAALAIGAVIVLVRRRHTNK